MPQSYARLYYHFVWCTWDRAPLLVGSVERHAYAAIQRLCREMSASVHAIGGVEDHVHLVVSVPRTVAVADFMERVKGASSRALNDSRASDVWEFRWQGGYGVLTVSPGDLKRVVRYVENQKDHHSAGDLWGAAERVWEDTPTPEPSGP